MKLQRAILSQTLDRVDSLINIVNIKAGFIITLNSTFLGLLLFKFKEIIITTKCSQGLLVLTVILSILSLFFSLLVVFPYLKSGNKARESNSILFYKSIYEMGLEKYKDHLSSITEEGIITDYSNQIFEISRGLSKKFQYITISLFLLFATIVSLVISSIFLL